MILISTNTEMSALTLLFKGQGTKRRSWLKYEPRPTLLIVYRGSGEIKTLTYVFVSSLTVLF